MGSNRSLVDLLIYVPWPLPSSSPPFHSPHRPQQTPPGRDRLGRQSRLPKTMESPSPFFPMTQSGTIQALSLPTAQLPAQEGTKGLRRLEDSIGQEPRGGAEGWAPDAWGCGEAGPGAGKV